VKSGLRFAESYGRNSPRANSGAGCLRWRGWDMGVGSVSGGDSGHPLRGELWLEFAAGEFLSRF